MRIAILLGCLFCGYVHGRALTIDESKVDFGEQYQFDEIVRDISVWNSSDHPVAVSVRKLMGPGTASIDHQTIEPHGTAKVHVAMPLRNAIGSVATRFMIDSTEPDGIQHYAIRVGGYVESVLDDPNQTIDFGIVESGHAVEERKFEVASSEFPDLKATKILEAPDFVSATIAADGRSIMLRPAKVSTLGVNLGDVRFALNSPRQKEASVLVALDAHGSVLPNQNPVEFGLQRRGNRSTFRLQLTSRDGKPFRVGTPQVKDAKLDVQSAACLPEAPGCKAFLLKVEKEQATGQIFGKVVFPLPDSNEQLAVNLAGLLLDDATPVQPLESALTPSRGTSQSTSANANSLASAIKQSVSPHDTPEPAGKGPLLKWQVGNESGIYGYAIFRGDSADGKFARINEQLIRARNEGDNITSDYQWRDTGAAAGKEYWYYIAIFYSEGRKQQLTGPQKVLAK
jgi:hypothetical protein